MNTNKSINRKIAIIVTAKFNRIMLNEIFANIIMLTVLTMLIILTKLPMMTMTSMVTLLQC